MSELKLDAPYFKKNLEIIVRDVESYTPNEMSRALARLSRLAKPTMPSDDEIMKIAKRHTRREVTIGNLIMERDILCFAKEILKKWGNGCE